MESGSLNPQRLWIKMCFSLKSWTGRFSLKLRLHQLQFSLTARMKWDISEWSKVITRVSRLEIKHRCYWSAAVFADHMDPCLQTCVQTCQSIDPTSACRLQTPRTSFFPLVYHLFILLPLVAVLSKVEEARSSWPVDWSLLFSQGTRPSPHLIHVFIHVPSNLSSAWLVAHS